jgi:hypothetical protein
MDVKKLINWRELSRLLAGNSDSIRANKIPNKYKDKVNNLEKKIDTWSKKD